MSTKLKITHYLHATKGWRKGSPPHCKRVCAVKKSDGKTYTPKNGGCYEAV